MKKTYIIPSVRISTLEANASILTGSVTNLNNEVTTAGQLGNENNMDDQEAKPWYRQ